MTPAEMADLDRLITKRYGTETIAELTGLPAEDIHDYRVARKLKVNATAKRRKRPDPVADALGTVLEHMMPRLVA